MEPEKADVNIVKYKKIYNFSSTFRYGVDLKSIIPKIIILLFLILKLYENLKRMLKKVGKRKLENLNEWSKKSGETFECKGDRGEELVIKNTYDSGKKRDL